MKKTKIVACISIAEVKIDLQALQAGKTQVDIS
jgi:hypothetical protein